MKTTYLWLFILVTIPTQTVFAQISKRSLHLNPTILSASGFEQEGAKSFSFSVGVLKSVLILSEKDSNPYNEAYQDSTGSILQEIQSSKSVQNSFTESTDKNEHIEIYPNPFVERVTLFIENFNVPNKNNYHFGLFDIAGNTLKTDRIADGQRQILLKALPKGIYFLILYKDGEQLKSFKLIKKDL